MFKNRLILISSSCALFVNIVLWIVLLRKFGLSGFSIPLHFNVVSGIDYVGSSRKTYDLPALGLALLLINLFIINLLHERSPLWTYFLAISSVVVQALLAVSVILLLSLNT